MACPVTQLSYQAPHAVRGIIANVLLPDSDRVPGVIGEIALRPHQLAAAKRIATLIAAHRGAMLAEPVGVGKTYTALAVAAAVGGPTLIAAPASLRAMWSESLRRCGVDAHVVTHEALSRGSVQEIAANLIIVDESHRLRSAATRRYALLASLCQHARVLLVSATPVQNRRADLASQLALFIGRSAWQLSDEELALYVVRDSASAAGLQPRIDGPHVLPLSIVDDDCLNLIVALPPPVPARDESIAAALLMYGLVHQWTSSRAALTRALQRRRARGIALMTAIEAGREPTRAELAAWTHSGDSIQLAFPELVTARAADEHADAPSLHLALDRHGAAVDALLTHLRASPDPDDARAALLHHVRERHPGERIIAFCHYAETVHALYARLRNSAGVAALTASGARVAGGRITRDDVLRQYMLPSLGARTIPVAERIELLLTTDLLSEGLNLQEASVIVHLDLPWNPARLDQRVGRAARMGSRHPSVAVYSIAPPASAERLLNIERRLREKLAVAQRTVGVAGRILPSVLAPPTPCRGIAEQLSSVHSELRSWTVHPPPLGPRNETVVAAVASNCNGLLALVHYDGSGHLVANVGGGITTSADALRRAVSAATGAPAAVDPHQANEGLAQLTHWLSSRFVESTIDFRAAAAARPRRAALLRVARALARAPRHQRSALAPLADAARAVAIAPLAEGAERVLETLVCAELPDEAWLRSIAAFGALNTGRTSASTTHAHLGTVAAVILLVKPSPAL
jgi:superfamily II DNA or RNA helicase